MMEAGLVFDGLLCLGLLWLAWQVVISPGQFRATVLFMVFGLLMAACWARLGTPDLALAEAAIGSGITGALLLNACKASYTQSQPASETPPGKLYRGACVVLCLLLSAGLAWLMLPMPGTGGPTADAVTTAQADHFLGNPVTSVLLDYRAYDTLLEMVVLLLAIMGARILIHQTHLPSLHPPRQSDPPMVAPLVAAATPLMLLTAFYLFWAGSHSPGGAFQAGALLGALGVMYRLTGRMAARDHASPLIRLLLIVGLGLFSLFAVWGLWIDGMPLSYPAVETLAYGLVLGIEFALMISIALTLMLMFSATPGLAMTRQPGEGGNQS
ncbi:hydrogenase subunit MbhD domain-containing protein [Natronospira proteinivora]|nr:hydrogenase subunit MbhD domain-containing protein [Natronospira proteinivora]